MGSLYLLPYLQCTCICSCSYRSATGTSHYSGSATDRYKNKDCILWNMRRLCGRPPRSPCLSCGRPRQGRDIGRPRDSTSSCQACPSDDPASQWSRARLWKCSITFTFTNSDHCTKEGKERKSIYIVPFIYYVHLKALRHGSHSFTCKYTMPAFPSYAFTRWRHL